MEWILEHTGGGCTALGLYKGRVYVWITEAEGACAPQEEVTECWTGLYYDSPTSGSIPIDFNKDKVFFDDNYGVGISQTLSRAKKLGEQWISLFQESSCPECLKKEKELSIHYQDQCLDCMDWKF